MVFKFFLNDVKSKNFILMKIGKNLINNEIQKRCSRTIAKIIGSSIIEIIVRYVLINIGIDELIIGLILLCI